MVKLEVTPLPIRVRGSKKQLVEFFLPNETLVLNIRSKTIHSYIALGDDKII